METFFHTNAYNFSKSHLNNLDLNSPRSDKNFNLNLNSIIESNPFTITNNNLLHTIKNSQTRNFINLDEFRELKLKREALDQKIKFRQDFENTFHSLKLNESKKEIKEIKFKNSLAQKRNEDLLNSIQSDILKCHQISKISEHSKKLLESEKNKYKNYLSYQLNNIRKDFQQKILAKQNEIQGIQKILQNRVNQNEEIFKMENEFTYKMSKMNEELMNSVKILQEKNKKIEEDRKSLMKSYFHIEEKTKEEFSKVLEEKVDKKEKLEIQANHQFLGEKSLSDSANTKINMDKDKDTNNENYFNKSPVIKQKERESLNISSKSKSPEKKNVNQENIFNKNPTHKNESELCSRKKSIDIASQNKDNNNKNLKEESKEVVELNLTSNQTDQQVKRLSTRKSGILGTMRRKKQEAEKEEKKTNTNLNTSLANEINMVTPKNINKTSNSENISCLENLKFSDPNTKLKNSISRNFLKQEDSLISEIERNENESIPKGLDNSQHLLKEKNLSQIESKQNQLTELEKILQDKPELTQVENKYKIQVVHKVLSQIEKNAKSIKPNNSSTYVYQAKHMNLNSNKENIKTKFYEILEIIFHKSTEMNKNVEHIVANISMDVLIFILLGILNSNKNLNLDPDNLKQTDYNILIFDNDLDVNIKEIFEIILAHIKKLIFDKKTSPNVAGNILANSLMNFEKDSRMTSNLVAVLERKLTHKSVQTVGGWGGFQFNRKIL